jgi:hypothetical protein
MQKSGTTIVRLAELLYRGVRATLQSHANFFAVSAVRSGDRTLQPSFVMLQT